MSSPAADNAVGSFGWIAVVDLSLRRGLNDSAAAYQQVNDERRLDEMQGDNRTVQCRR